jgi:hypothetical protein
VPREHPASSVEKTHNPMGDGDRFVSCDVDAAASGGGGFASMAFIVENGRIPRAQRGMQPAILPVRGGTGPAREKARK